MSGSRARRPRTCEMCALTYTPNYSQQRTCGRACGWVLRLRDRPSVVREPRVITCPTCGDTFEPRSTQRYCRATCKPKRVWPDAGNTEPPPLARQGSYVERLLARYEVQSNGCWQWTGTYAGTGYGQIGRQGRTIGAHRAMWEHALHRPVPEGLDLDHLCRNKGCVNPDHLEPVTRSENIRRALRARAS